MFTSNLSSSGFVALALAAGSAFAAAPGDFPSGTYIATGSTTTLTFDGKGRFHVDEDGALKVEGDYTVNADQMRFTDQNGPWACTDAKSKSASYRWKADHATVTFSKVDEDACEGRVQALAHPWKKQS